MASIVTCDKVGQALLRWLRQASDEQLASFCSVLNCDTSVQSGVVNTEGTQLTLYVGKEGEAEGDMRQVVIELNQPERLVAHDNSLTGDGTADNPLAVSAAWLRSQDLVIRPEQFGSTTGADASAALNLALAAGAGREVRLLPGATYNVQQSLIISSRTTLNAKGARLVRNAAIDNMIRNQSDGVTGGYNAATDITIEGGEWVGNNAAFPGNTTLIAFGHAARVKVLNATITSASGWHHIELNGVSNALISGNTFSGGRDTASIQNEALQIDLNIDMSQFPWFGPADSTPCTDIKVVNNTFNDVGTAIGSHSGVAAVRHSAILIEGNSISGAYFAGVSALNWADVKIVNNRFDRGHYGIRALSVGTGANNRQYVIEGNTFYNQGNSPYAPGAADGRGVFIQANNDGLFNISSVTVANNTFIDINTSTSQNAIAVNYCSDVAITGNTVRSTRQSAISLFTVNRAVVTGNSITGSNGGAVADQSGLAFSGCTDLNVVGNSTDTARAFSSTRALIQGNNVGQGPIAAGSNTGSSIASNLVAGVLT